MRFSPRPFNNNEGGSEPETGGGPNRRGWAVTEELGPFSPEGSGESRVGRRGRNLKADRKQAPER